MIHISEDDAARDFAGLLARIRSGAEVVIERGSLPPIVMRARTEPTGRLLSESIAMAEQHAKELGYDPVMDAEFAADLEKIISNRAPATLLRGNNPWASFLIPAS